MLIVLLNWKGCILVSIMKKIIIDILNLSLLEVYTSRDLMLLYAWHIKTSRIKMFDRSRLKMDIYKYYVYI